MCTAARDVGDRERAGLRRQHRLDHHLEEQVAQLVFERVVRAERDLALRRVGRQLFDRLDDLVGLFEHVPAQAVVRLLGVPGAAARAAQPLGEREQARELGPDRCRAGVDEERREMVGVDVAVDVGRARR